MRTATHEDVKREKLLLAQLNDDWQRLKRPQVNLDLRSSLFTKMRETEANIKIMEEAVLKREAAERRAAARRREPGKSRSRAAKTSS